MKASKCGEDEHQTIKLGSMDPWTNAHEML